MSSERYHPYYLNDAEAIREQIFQEAIVESIVKGVQEQETEKTLERLRM